MATNSTIASPDGRQGNVCCYCGSAGNPKRSLFRASQAGHDECLKELLLKSGANVKSGVDEKSRDTDGESAGKFNDSLIKAVTVGHDECLKELLLK